jgi:hypothetical protein
LPPPTTITSYSELAIPSLLHLLGTVVPAEGEPSVAEPVVMVLACEDARAAVHIPAATAETPPWSFDHAAGSRMNFSTSASLPASNLPLAFAAASTSHQVASECRVTPSSRRICGASGKMS